MHKLRLLDVFFLGWFGLPVVITYRIILAAYCFVWLVFSGLSSTLGGDTWFIYLTDWTYTCVTTYFIAAAILSTTEFIKQRRKPKAYQPVDGSDGAPPNEAEEQHPQYEATNENSDNEPASGSSSDDVIRWYHKAVWVLYSMASDMSVVVTVSYWSLLYHGFKIYPLNVNVHLLNSVFMLAETILCSIPIRLFHIIYPLCYGAVYISFTVVYWSLGGRNNEGEPYIYPVLDYSHALPRALVVVFGVLLVVLPAAHLFLYGLHKLRRHLSKKKNDR